MGAQVQIYDTTLRDGMGGEGMSLSPYEKVRVVHALDRLGVQVVEAGFLRSNPKDEAHLDLPSRQNLEHAGGAAVRMARPPGGSGGEDPPLRHPAASCCPISAL